MAIRHSTTTTEKQTDGTVRNDVQQCSESQRVGEWHLERAAQKKQMFILQSKQFTLDYFVFMEIHNLNRG